MTSVGIREGIKYGFLLFGYFLGIFLGGGVLAAIGVLLSGLSTGADVDSGGIIPMIGVFFIFVGGLVFCAGFFGISYKIVADGVERGIESSELGDDDSRRDRRSSERSRRRSSQ